MGTNSKPNSDLRNAHWVLSPQLILPKMQHEYIRRINMVLREKSVTSWQWFLKSSLPFCTSSSSRPLHSLRKMLAPVRLPSPPHTHRLVMPFFTRLKAAASLPSRVVKALQRALPIIVPPYGIKKKKEVMTQIKTSWMFLIFGRQMSCWMK